MENQRNPTPADLKKSLFTVLAVLLAVFIHFTDGQAEKNKNVFVQEGDASYYANSLDGRPTASGENYSRKKYTAAHPKLPFGTRLRVTNLETGKSVEVRVNDRGPYGGKRIIDVSEVAARELGMLERGTIKVRIERIE